jgi:hypothetical protein
MTPLLPSGAFTPYALLPATTATASSAPTLTLVDRSEPFKFRVNDWVFAPTLYIYSDNAEPVPACHQPRKIAARYVRDGTRWYVLNGHDWLFKEDELSRFVEIYPTYYQTQAVAAA